MTVPTNAESAHFRKSCQPCSAEPVPLVPLVPRVRAAVLPRRRGLLIGGVVAVGFGVVALVLAFPRLAAPIGTAAGVVAVLVPLIHRVGRGESSDRETAGKP
ncbi:hypothetical protein [Streptomyces sp. NPDC003006]